VREEERRKEVVATHWCVLCREDGCLELYSIPEFKLVFSVRNFSSAPTTLKDSGTLPQQQSSPHPVASGAKSKAKTADRPEGVGEVLLLGVESHVGGPSHPYLLALLDNELMVYRAFHYKQTQNVGHLQLRFSKVLHKAILHDRKKHKLEKQLSHQVYWIPVQV
jgi:cleavage and polyadenylation specificity factor subunit 1